MTEEKSELHTATFFGVPVFTWTNDYAFNRSRRDGFHVVEWHFDSMKKFNGQQVSLATCYKETGNISIRRKKGTGYEKGWEHTSLLEIPEFREALLTKLEQRKEPKQ